MPRGGPGKPKEFMDYMRSLQKRRSLAERFWEKVNKAGPDECWTWFKNTQANGYGRMWDPPRVRLAHRVAWELAGRELPKWPMVIDHICRNRVCMNVRHMRVVSQTVNTLDNSDSVWAKNKRKTHCPQGHEYTPENTALQAKRNRSGRMGKGRICLACHPTYWRYAVVPRSRPPGSKVKPGDPDYESSYGGHSNG